MEVISRIPNSTTILSEDRNMLLQHLDRNQKDIAQYYAKLCSYVSEPRTYHQFSQLRELKDTANELRNTNTKISSTLKNDPRAVKLTAKFIQNYLQKFHTFSTNVTTYIEEVKVHRTACI